MDTITHGLFGYTMYKSLEEKQMEKNAKWALLFTALVSNEIPDIDVLANLTETGRVMQQMWHRGLTHSLFFVPIWAGFIYLCCRIFFKEKNIRLFYYALLGVFIHDTSDSFNAWGTGYWEPFSTTRVTIGTLSIVDFVFWAIFIGGLLFAKIKKEWPTPKIYRWVATLMFLHFCLQTTQGLIIEWQEKARYDQVEVAATFLPAHFKVVGKKGKKIELAERTLFTMSKSIRTFSSADDLDLRTLFQQNPKAKVLYDWVPIDLIIDEETQIGIVDPRFYNQADGSFMLGEFIKK